VSQEPIEDEAQEIKIFSFMSDDPDEEDNLYDFRPIDRPEPEVVDPKDSSAPESVDSSETPVTEPQEPTAPAEKDSGEKPGSESGTPTSSSPDPKTSSGNVVPPVSE
jgi:hypothetical protein